MQLTRDKFIPCIDKTKGVTPGTYEWVRICKSTVFDFAFNPATEERSFICDKNNSTEITGYAPSMEQEVILDNTDELYKFMDEFLHEYPTGSDAEIPVLLVRPALVSGEPTAGEVWEHAVISAGSINSVDGKLTFTINFNGDPIKGTVAISQGKVTFTPSEAA